MKNRTAVYISILSLIILFAGRGDRHTTLLYGDDSIVEKATLHENSASAAFQRQDFKTAIEEQKLSVFFSERSGTSPAVTANRYYYLGMYRYYAGDYRNSRADYEKAIKLAGPETEENRVTLALMYGGAGSTCQMTGEYADGIAYCEKGLEIIGRAKLTKEQEWYPASIHYPLGIIYQYTGDYRKSEKFLTMARQGYASAFGEKSPYAAAAIYGLGETAKLTGDHKTAITYFNEALQIYISSYGEEHPYVGTVYYALGYECHYSGEYGKAITHYLRAVDLYRKAYGERNSFTAIAYYGLGRTFIDTGDLKQALDYLEKARDIDIEVFGEEHINTIATLFGIANVLELAGRTDDAYKVMSRTLELQRKVLGEEHPETVNSLIELGRYLAQMGKDSESSEQYRRALEISRKHYGESHPNIARIYSLIGYTSLRMKDTAKAEKSFSAALEIAKRWEIGPQIIESSANLADVKMETGDFSGAKKLYSETVSVIESQRSATDAERSAVMTESIDIYRRWMESGMKSGDTASVFTAAESMKARSFLDRISLDAALSADGIPPGKRTRMLELNELIESLIGIRREAIRKYSGPSDEGKLAEIGKEIEKASAEFSAIDAELMKNSRYSRLRKGKIATLKEARELCDGETAILEYIIGKKQGEKKGTALCLVIRKDTAETVELDGTFDYNSESEKFRDALIGPNRERERDRLNSKLYGKLLSPLEKKLGGINKIIVIPDGNLSSIPFDTLRPGNDASYLCERFTVTLEPSVSILLMTRERRLQQKRTALLAFGGASYSGSATDNRTRGSKRGAAISGSGKVSESEAMKKSPYEYYRSRGLTWGNLPGTLDEVREIGSVSGGVNNAVIVTGDEVTEESVKKMSRSGKLSSYRFIHFACHGYFDQDHPAYSSVVLSEVSGSIKTGEDGYLSVPEVASLTLQADTVTLSACETGLSGAMEGEGIVGLTRAFQEAGAAKVTVTLWQVADAPTKEFMTSLYRKIRNGATFSKAITDTKREFIKSDKYSDPYFWSPFVLYGE